MTISFSLVIPCYNEAANLPHLLARCSAVTAANPNVEIVLVDNGSTDASPQILQQLLPEHPGCRSVRVEKNKGYGFGIVSGLRAAKGDFLGWTHADLQTDPGDVLAGLALFERSPTPERLFVKGRRHGRPPGDVVFTVGMSVFETGLLGRPLWDINAQPTMFPRAFFESWALPPDDFALDLYAYYNARRSGMTVERFAVLFGKRLHGQSHWNVNWAAKWKFIRRTVDFSMRLRAGAYR
jgi:glycosyltransferase involved in cell wall biosynthesis